MKEKNDITTAVRDALEGISNVKDIKETIEKFKKKLSEEETKKILTNSPDSFPEDFDIER